MIKHCAAGSDRRQSDRRHVRAQAIVWLLPAGTARYGGISSVGALALCVPGHDMSGRNESPDFFHRLLRDGRFIEEFDDQRQPGREAQEVRGVDLALLAEAGDAAKYGDAMNTVLVMQY